MGKVVKTISKLLSFILVFLGMLGMTCIFMLVIITHGPSSKARDLFTTTMLETGALKWMVNLTLDADSINDIVAANSLVDMKDEVNINLINLKKEDEVKEDIEIIPITGNNFYATMMIVHDPSRVSVGSNAPFSSTGITLEELVKKFDAIGGVNGGLFVQNQGKGGWPIGVVVSQGKLVYNSNTARSLVLVGLDNDNILKIISLNGMSKKQISDLVKNENIRDAVTFQEEVNDTNNHFVKLIVNGEKRVISGTGSGANPRTAIGQTKDGSILLLVTDGRGAAGHLGATAEDLINIMDEYGAINAANIDGGSSSAMYYQGKYLMTSTTLYYSNSSYRLPDGFIVK